MILDAYAANTLQKVVQRLKAGELVVIPTETVYGLAGDATNSVSIKNIFSLKSRSHERPISVLIADANQMREWSNNIPDIAWQLAKKFWPGPLTLIVPKAPHVPDILTAQQKTIGLRVPAHPIALEILQKFGSGLATPSANLFNQPSPITAEAAAKYFSEELWVVDGGTCEVGVASTIVDCSVSPPKILREGVISSADIFAALSHL